MNSPSYAQLQRNHNEEIEVITQSGGFRSHKLSVSTGRDCNLDYERIKLQVHQEVATIRKKKERRESERNYTTVLKDINRYYDGLLSGKEHGPLPTRSIFQHLPIIQQCLDLVSPANEDIAESLRKQPALRGIVARQLRNWQQDTKTGLGTILGISVSDTTKLGGLHPTERMTARYLCSKCHHLAARYQMDESLDLAGVCGHECRAGGRRNVRKWNISNFTKDEQVSAFLDLDG